jgi:hypothetical protein
MRLLVLAALAGLSACGKQEDPRMVEGREAVKSLLTDPSSAQFRNLRFHPARGQARHLCGEVNAKNRMGGYVGFQAFSFDLVSKEAEVAIDIADAGSLMNMGLYAQGSEQITRRVVILERCFG